MLLPEHFKAYVKIRIDNQNFNKFVSSMHWKDSNWLIDFFREVMPSHFKVKEYCPLVFRAFREYWKVHDSSFRVRKINFFWREISRSSRIHWLNHLYHWMKQQNQVRLIINRAIVGLFWNVFPKKMSSKFIIFFQNIIAYVVFDASLLIFFFSFFSISSKLKVIHYFHIIMLCID